MNIKQKFESIDQSQLSESQKEILSKIKSATKNFTIEDKKAIEKVNTALDNIISKLEKTKPQAIKKEVKEKEKEAPKQEEKKEAPEKPTKNRTKKQKEGGSGKRTIFSIAKEIRKSDESWDEAKKRAKKIMEQEKDETTKKMKTETEKLLAFIKRKKELEGLSGTSVKKDSKIEALPKGRRVSKKGWKNQYGESEGGRVYYENRDNRTDRLAPSFADKVYLEEGGYADKGVYVETLDEEIDLSDDAKVRARKTQEGRNMSWAELREKHGGSPEAMAFNNGGTIIGTPETPLGRNLGIDYTTLVGETGSMSAGEMFAYGGKSKSKPSMRELYIEQISLLTGARIVGVQKFVDDNNLNDSELSNLMTGLGRGIIKRSDFITAMSGEKNNPMQKEIIDFAKSDKAYKMADGGNVIDAFQMRTVRGIDNKPTEVLTNEQKVQFATGGMSAGEMFANGGGIPNNYQDRYYADIWDIDWTQEQKNHFLQDHKNEIGFDEEFYGVSIREKTTKKIKSSKGQEVGFAYIDVDKLLKTKSSELPKYVKLSLQKHIREGQYAMGGKLTRIELGDAVRYKDEAWYLSQKKGVVGIVNMKQGAWGSDFPFIPLSKIDVERELKDFYGNPIKKGDIPYLVEDFAKGGYTNERRHVNKSQDYEVRYAKDKPNRTGYLGKRSFDEGGLFEKVKWQDVEVGDSARVKEINRMGLIVKTYGRKFHLKFPNGTEKTFDASELEFFKLENEDYESGGIAEKSLYIPTYQVLKVHTTDGKVFENVYSDTNVITGVYVSEKPLRKKDVDDKNQLELFRKGGLPKTAIYIPRYKVDFIETEYDGDIQGNHIYGGVWIDMKKQFRLVEEAKKQGRFGNKPKFKVDDLVYNKRTKSVGIVRIEDEKGETKTDADGNVNTSELEKYNPLKNKNHKNAKVAPSTQKEIDSRGLFKPFSKYEGGGSTKRGGAMQLAKEIRKDGESWQSALKRANEQMRKK